MNFYFYKSFWDFGLSPWILESPEYVSFKVFFLWGIASPGFWLAIISGEIHKRRWVRQTIVSPVGLLRPLVTLIIYLFHHTFGIPLSLGDTSISTGWNGLPDEDWEGGNQEPHPFEVWDVVSVSLTDHGCCTCTFTVKTGYENNKR